MSNSNGAVYIFQKDSGGTWTEQQKLTASDGQSTDYFGFSVSISGSKVVIGAPYEDHDLNGSTPFNNSGSAYVFQKNVNNVWVQQQKLVATTRGDYFGFGQSVSISGDQMVIGAFGEELPNLSGGLPYPTAGAAYVYEETSGANWTLKQKLTQSFLNQGGPFSSTRFGCSVSISDRMIVVGAEGFQTNAGIACIYKGKWFRCLERY